MTDKEFQAIKDRWATMPELPWEWDAETKTLFVGPVLEEHGDFGTLLGEHRGILINESFWEGDSMMGNTLANARTDIGALTTEVERLRKALVAEIKSGEDRHTHAIWAGTQTATDVYNLFDKENERLRAEVDQLRQELTESRQMHAKVADMLSRIV